MTFFFHYLVFRIYRMRRLFLNWVHLAIIEFGFRRIWRILQIKEGVIHGGRRPRCTTPFEICRILHILRKPNSIIALLFIQNISSFLSFAISLFVFPLTICNTTLSPGLLSQQLNNLQRAALIQYGEDSFQIWWSAAGYGELCVWF